MMRSYTFGAHGDMDSVQQRLGRLWGVTLQLHDSSFRGGDFYMIRTRELEIIVQRNFIEDDGELSEPGLPDHSVVVYISQDVALPAFDFADSGLHLLKAWGVQGNSGA
ncbi:MAG: hypothetical protein U0Q19_16300 [Kineosporiaceae bacterium]